jgi:hypothetical protein
VVVVVGFVVNTSLIFLILFTFRVIGTSVVVVFRVFGSVVASVVLTTILLLVTKRFLFVELTLFGVVVVEVVIGSVQQKRFNFTIKTFVLAHLFSFA